MKLQNSNKLNIVYCLLIAVIVAVISFSLLSPIQKASADYNELPSDYIVNFNQLVSNTNINFTNSNNYSGWKDICTLTNGHRYYIRLIKGSEFVMPLYNKTGTTLIRGDGASYPFIYNCNQNGTLSFYVNSANSSYTNFNVIDLTLMYGSGNDNLTLEQCNNYFTAEYYTYTAGTPMPLSASYMDGYNTGVSDTLGSFTYKLNTAAVVNSLQSVDLPGYVGIVSRGTTAAGISADGSDVNLPTGYLPFLSPIPAGSHFRIGGRLSHNQGNSNVKIGIGVYYNGVMQILSNNITASGYNGTLGGVIEFDAPVDISGIYIIAYDETASFKLTIYSLYVEVLNVDYSQLISSAYQNGYGAGADNYAPGSVGYQSIYQEGYNAGLSNGNTIGSAWDFIGGTFNSIGSIFSLEVMPNITLGVFIAIPLLLGLLLFILKVTRG